MVVGKLKIRLVSRPLSARLPTSSLIIHLRLAISLRKPRVGKNRRGFMDTQTPLPLQRSCTYTTYYLTDSRKKKLSLVGRAFFL
jgi:hypothetical protein